MAFCTQDMEFYPTLSVLVGKMRFYMKKCLKILHVTGSCNLVFFSVCSGKDLQDLQVLSVQMV